MLHVAIFTDKPSSQQEIMSKRDRKRIGKCLYGIKQTGYRIPYLHKA